MKLAKPIQIIKKKNHLFDLNLNEIEAILASDELKDRHVSIVSIAGDLRKGKSFLLGFFIKYLNARYKTHDVSDWIGECKNDDEMDGFHFCGGQEADTKGIWMWSDIFTYDRDDGEKIAIILLDTQGIFDNESSMKECTAIFAISMMLSSVQCFNVMMNIQESDLQHLHLFTDYGVSTMNSSDQKPFQKFIFVVRDWPYSYQNNYGYSQAITKQKLAETTNQSIEMRQLRTRIRSTIDTIETFLMPFPGPVVLEEHFKGKLHGINKNFIECVKEFVPSILAPENLIIRQINGQKMRICDLKTYLKTFVDAFNENKTPTPQTLAMANATAIIKAIYYDCLKLYTDSMYTEFDRNQSYFDEIGLQKIHNISKDKAILKFREAKKLGDLKFIANYEERLEKAINKENGKFSKKNERKKELSSRGPWANIAGLGIGVAAAMGTAAVTGVGVGAVGGLGAGLAAGGCFGMAVGVTVCITTKRALEWVLNNWNMTDTKKTK